MKKRILKPIKIGKAEINFFVLVLLVISMFFNFFREILILYSIAFLHEAAHIFVTFKTGEKISKVEILPFGITAMLDDYGIKKTGNEIKIALAGPALNFLLAYLAYGFYKGNWRDFLISSNIIMGTFNLLPAMPLDGGRILKALLSAKYGHIKASSFVIKITIVTACAVGVLGILALYVSKFNFSLLLICAFLIANITEERKTSGIIIMKDILYSRKKLAGGFCKGQPLIAYIDEKAKNILKMITYDKYFVISVLDGKGSVVCTVTETELIEYMAVYGMEISMKIFADNKVF
ncbi:MAG: site-2 protease family protein [Clostridia bacterium]|nr:site-2 protease family protein [Clostridia bacterium]